MRAPLGLAGAVMVILTLHPAAAQVLTIRPEAVTAGQYERIQFRISGVPSVQFPYDPAIAEVTLEVRCPSGRVARVPAFWMQPVERRVMDGKRDWLYPTGAAGWRARFASEETGRHRARVVCAKPSAGASAWRLFDVKISSRSGYVRRSKTDPRRFALSTGQPFFAIGQNLAFVGPQQYMTLARAEEAIGKIGSAGGNWIRVWAGCSDWAMAIESRKSAWGRSWSPQPAISDAPELGVGRKIVIPVLQGGAATADPSYPVALKPGTRYTLTARLASVTGGNVTIEALGTALGEPVRLPGSGTWVTVTRNVTAAAGQWWLGSVRLRLDTASPLRVAELSLREAGGGPDLLWEADPSRTVMGNVNPIDAAMLDALLAAGEKSGVHLQVCLLERDSYMSRLERPGPAYDAAIGDAKRMWRYAVARWGYSTAVASWEHWNEQNPGLPTERFYREVGEYLAAIDPWRHMRATSAWGPAPNDWHSKGLDQADLHWYLRPNWSDLWKDAAAATSDRAAFLLKEAPGRPALLSEFGLADEKWGLSEHMAQDKNLLHLHDALWASAVSGLAGTTMHWWWEKIDEMDGYRHYRPLAGFLGGIRWRNSGPHPIPATVSPGPVRAAALTDGRSAVVWLNDPNASWWEVVVAKRTPALVEGTRVTVKLPAGRYRATWWDTTVGKSIREDVVTATSAGLVLTSPPFRRDVACRLTATGTRASASNGRTTRGW